LELNGQSDVLTEIANFQSLPIVILVLEEMKEGNDFIDY
jgi:hypothetical protein